MDVPIEYSTTLFFLRFAIAIAKKAGVNGPLNGCKNSWKTVEKKAGVNGPFN